MTNIDEILAGYAAAAAEVATRFEAISSSALLAPVADLLPRASSNIVDVGAGTGRDAAWLAQTRGHRMLAVEPVAAFRQIGMARHGDAIEWLDDRLPHLHRLVASGRHFATALGVAVWQHLDDRQRAVAMIAIAGLLAPGGLFILSLRHGAGAPARPVVPCRTDTTLALAHRARLKPVRMIEAASMQRANRDAGVLWTWIALARVD